MGNSCKKCFERRPQKIHPSAKAIHSNGHNPRPNNMPRVHDFVPLDNI